MRVLVSAGSKYGSTEEIAEVIGLTLQRDDIDVDVVPPDKVDRVDIYDAFVLGSAVYAGHWLQSSRTLVKAYAGQLEDKPVWLFSSGPLGHPAKPEGDPADVAEISDELAVRGHKVFAGRLDKNRLSFMERAMVMALHAPEGDHRNWSEIRRFAKDIAAELTGGAGAGRGRREQDAGAAADSSGDDAAGDDDEPPDVDRVIDLTDDASVVESEAVRGG